MVNKTTDLFLDLRETLKEDLRKTGFSPNADGGPGEEPKIPTDLSSKTNDFLKTLYDEFLSYYAYLTDQVAQDTCDATVSKARLEFKGAQAALKAATDPRLTNADMRKAVVETDAETLGAKRDYIYFKSKLAVQEDRKRKISKCMDRIGRELWFRTQDESEPSSEFFIKKPQRSGVFPGAYKGPNK
jgi:hypothetical protein